MTRIFEHLKISGYRGFEKLDLHELGQVNIFVGDNNSGKTSLLEAVAILCDPLNPFRWLEISQRRGYAGRALMTFRPDIEAIKWIFPQTVDALNGEAYQSEISIEASGRSAIQKLDAKLGTIYSLVEEKSIDNKFGDETELTESEAILSGDETDLTDSDTVLSGIELEVMAHLNLSPSHLSSDNLEVRKETFQFWEKERFVQRKRERELVKNATIFPSYSSSSEPIIGRLSRIILKEKNANSGILDLMRSFDENIVDLQILSPNSKATLYIEHKELGFAPLYVFGDGFKRTLAIALTLLTIEEGIILIDEIETSIHISALCRVFSWLLEICRQRNIQLFITTHSLEAIDAMLQPEVSIDDIVAFRFNVRRQLSQRFSGDLLYRLRSERGLDMR